MVRAKKKWGQHWLASKGLADDLAALIGLEEGDRVVEIGPGTGLLTGAMLNRGAHVTAIEVDPQCADTLAAEFGQRSFTLIHRDIREVSPVDVAWGDGGVHLVGNLPYNLSGPILRWTADVREHLADAHFMLQREVADRITAAAGSKVYGALSVQMQWQFETTIVKRLSPGAFRPPPKVRSAFLRLSPRATPPPTSSAQQLVRDGFAQRRKTLQRALVAGGWPAQVVSAALVALDIRPDARAEALSPTQWTELAARVGTT